MKIHTQLGVKINEHSTKAHTVYRRHTQTNRFSPRIILSIIFVLTPG